VVLEKENGSTGEVFSKWASVTTGFEARLYARLTQMEVDLESHFAQQNSHMPRMEKIMERFVKEGCRKGSSVTNSMNQSLR